MQKVAIASIMNHKHITVKSASLNTDSGCEEHVLSNEGTLTAPMGVMGKIEEFCPLFYYLACRRVLPSPRASALKTYWKKFCLKADCACNPLHVSSPPHNSSAGGTWHIGTRGAKHCLRNNSH